MDPIIFVKLSYHIVWLVVYPAANSLPRIRLCVAKTYPKILVLASMGVLYVLLGRVRTPDRTFPFFALMSSSIGPG